MKTIKILFFGFALLLGLSSCSEKWLEHELTGNSITEEELASLDGTTYKRVRGLYALMFQYGGDHQTFGQKSIDIANDLLSGDMALTNSGYGWWSSDANLINSTSTGGRTSQIWGDNYLIIANANNIIRMLEKKPAADWSLTDSLSYAECLTLRAYSYFNLGYMFSPSPKDESENKPNAEYVTLKEGLDLFANYPTCPLYLGKDEEYSEETGLLIPKVLYGISEIYQTVYGDLEEAIAIFEALELKAITRESKLMVNKDVAHVLAAYAYMQFARYEENIDAYQVAYDHAMAVVNSADYKMLDYANVLTTGFSDVNNRSWIWGLDVTRENSTSLASFWGHIDIHTYSYAAAGGILAIDKNLYDEIPETDIRKKWFNAGKSYNYCPQNKFYDGTMDSRYDPIVTGSLEGVDRDWLNDIVYMRVEEAHLLAAEAAFRADNLSEAQRILSEFLAQRDTTAAEAVKTMNKSDFEKQLCFNWRVEMWGEGRGLLTFKRFAQVANKKRGNNHYYKSDTEQTFDAIELTYQLPYSEYAYNQALNTSEE